MKLRTSFFNGTVLKKDLTRFAPVWGLYTIFLLVLFTLNQLPDPALAAENISESAEGIAIVSFLYAGICANVLFGDLFHPRMCNALHAMPLRREGWFLTHTVAGLLFCLIPTVIVTVFLMVMLQEFFYIALLWLAVMVLEFLFFFGVGTISVMCAGNRLGMIAVYFIINLFAGLVYVVADQIYEPLLYGIDFESQIYKFLCPVIWLSDCDLINFNYSYRDEVGTFKGLYPEGWLYLGAVAVVGLVLLVLSTVLYRKRKLERAGDFIAWKPLNPVFLVIFTLACGILMYLLEELFGLDTSMVLIAVGMTVGFFAGRMLLERTVRVFRWKNLLGFAVFAVIFAGSLVITWLDPLGITWYVPETEEVEFVRIYRDVDSYVYDNPDIPCLQAQTPAEIDKFREVHSYLITEDGDKSDGVSQVEVLYQLKDGKTVYRYYSIDENTQAYDILQEHFSQPEYIFCAQDWDGFVKNVESIDISLGGNMGYDYGTATIYDLQQIEGLLAAIKADCQENTMAQPSTFHVGEQYLGWIFVNYDVIPSYNGEYALETAGSFQDVSVYPCNTHTIAYLEKLLEEYQPE